MNYYYTLAHAVDSGAAATLEAAREALKAGDKALARQNAGHVLAVAVAAGHHDEARRVLALCGTDDLGEFTLPRTGDASLRFRGTVLAEVDGQRVSGRDQNRWHEITLYRTEGGRYVVQIVYHTCWDGELGHDFAEALATPDDVVNALRAYDPASRVKGFPDHPSYAERQAKLLRDLDARYEALVGEVLASPEFAERVE